jgi:hypothetical protein
LQKRPANVSESVWTQWKYLFPNKSMASYGLDPQSYGEFFENDVGIVLSLNQRLRDRYSTNDGMLAEKPRELTLIRIYILRRFPPSTSIRADFTVCLVLADNIHGIGAWNQYAFKCADALSKLSQLNFRNLKHLLGCVCTELGMVTELRFPDVNDVELSDQYIGGSVMTYKMTSSKANQLLKSGEQAEHVFLRIQNPARESMAMSGYFVRPVQSLLNLRNLRYRWGHLDDSNMMRYRAEPQGALSGMHWPIIEFSQT